MDLWIRSQDREKLVKINDKIYCEHSEEPLDEYGDVLYFYDISTDADILGTYSTEERAQEVIGEIQKLLTGQNIMCFKNTGLKYHDHHDLYGAIMKHKWVALQDDATVDFISPSTIVYEMPEE